MFVHELSDVLTCNIGAGTRVWQYSVILEGAVIGKDCNICAHTFIESNVTIGDAVTIKSGVYIWNGTEIEDGVFIGPSATFSNDDFPRSRVYSKVVLRTKVERGASIGANATILPGITVGANAMIGAGAVVTRDVPAATLVYGNPARVIKYLDNNILAAN